MIEKVRKLLELYKSGALGGEKMPEDSNPALEPRSEENYLYFTLPMALNYQRDSYKLWQSALETYFDTDCAGVFNPREVIKMSAEELKRKLVKHRVALQTNKQPLIWRALCETFSEDFGGSVKNLFIKCDFDIVKIKDYILKNKKKFPYLSGTKILNYWLFVMSKYTDAKFKNGSEISVAPDTHVLQSSVKLGLIKEEDLKRSDVREFVSEKWRKLLEGTGIQPIDIHTPLWLYSRGGFKESL